MSKRLFEPSNDVIHCLELFSGNGDISKFFKSKGFDCVSVDYDKRKAADLHYDVYKLSADFYKAFDFVWASPDCTSYSLAGHGKYRGSKGNPIHEYAKFCDLHNAVLVNNLVSSGVPFVIENPRAFLRKMPFMKGLFRTTVYYSVYGAEYAKPTDLFSNRSFDGFFDSRCLLTGKTLDCVSSGDFLSRCVIPEKLIVEIYLFVLYLLRDREISDDTQSDLTVFKPGSSGLASAGYKPKLLQTSIFDFLE